MDQPRYFETDTAWRELVVWGSPEQIARLLDLIDQRLPTGWRRNPAAEDRYKRTGGSVPAAYCYVRSVGGADVWLWLNQPAPTRLVGGNVIPAPDHTAGSVQLVSDTITTFRETVLVPASNLCGVRLDANRVGPLSQVTADVMEVLWQFADVAKRTLPLQPVTLAKWRAFVIAARSAGAAFAAEELAGWFQDKGWPPADARALADKFFEDAWLLSEYDEARKPA